MRAVGALGLLLVARGAAAADGASSPVEVRGAADGWVPLWNGKDFAGLEGSLTDGGDWRKIFTIEDGTIHVAAPYTFGFLSTTKTYSHYRCRVQYRWGAGPGKERNSGLLYHSRGDMLPAKHWPPSLEFQFRRGEAGALWVIGGPFVSAYQKDQVFTSEAAGGALVRIGGGGYRTVKRRADAEREGWNQAELVVRGDRSVHVLNGVTAFESAAIEILDETGGRVPLASGAIRLQSEGAEIWFRNFEIQELDPSTGAPLHARTTNTKAAGTKARPRR